MLVTTFYVFMMTICSLRYVNSATTKRSADDAVKFPGPMQDVDYGQTDSDVPPECQGKTYCTVKPTDYPQEKFNNMFKGTKSRASFQPSLEVEVVNRQGDPDEKDDCESVVTYEPLYKVVPKGEPKGKWRMVIQVPGENFVQRVRLETCVSQGTRCFTVFPMASEFETFCKQKYSTWEVLVSDGKNGTEKIKTDLPICCSCHYKALDFVNRFGKPKEEPKMTMKKH